MDYFRTLTNTLGALAMQLQIFMDIMVTVTMIHVRQDMIVLRGGTGYNEQWSSLRASFGDKNPSSPSSSSASASDQNQAASVNIQGNNNKVNIGQSESASSYNFAHNTMDFIHGYNPKASSISGSADNPRCLLLCSSQ